MTQRNNILASAQHLFLRYGIKSITMDDVAKELGISKKTLYQFVDNKSDLIEQIIELHLKNEIVEMDQIRSASKDAIEEILGFATYGTQMLRELNPRTIYDLQKYHKKAWELMESLHQEHIYTFIKSNLETGISQGLYRSDLHPDIIAKLYVGKTMLVVNEDVFPLKEYNKQNLFEAYIQYHIHGIASAKGLRKLEKYMAKKD